MNSKRIRPWKRISTEKGPELPLFNTRIDRVENPRNGKTLQAVVLETTDWVNIVAITPEGKIVVVEQHRFGIGNPTLEIPAGLVDPGEDPVESAMRELEEETGYRSDHWKGLGWVEANPAFLNNRCHFWLARGVLQTKEQLLDEGEDILVSALTFDELQQAIERGRMRNSLTLMALSRVFDLRKTACN